MSDAATSGETSVASAGTPSAPPAPAPVSFGTSRGSGLARGKRPIAPAPATTESAAVGEYKPTAVQVIAHQREYINPFAPAPAPAAVEAPAKVEQPVASVPAVPSTPITPVASVATSQPTAINPPAPQAVVETKPQLNILPPEDKTRPAQSWEIGGAQPTQPSTNAEPRREARKDFRATRHEERPAASSDQREQPRREFRPRDPRESREPREQREPRSFEPKPKTAPVAPLVEPKKSGFFGWLKSLFSSEAAPETKTSSDSRPTQPADDNRRYEGGQQHRHHRGGRGRGGFRNDNRGPQNNPSSPEGSTQGGRSEGDRQFDGGQRRRRHRGGRGRFRGDNRGGDNRPDRGGPSSS